MTSLRRTALIWMTVLLTVVGLAAFAITYEFARQEAADFLDGQLHQIALNAGDTATDIAAPSDPPDPEDQFVIEIWTAAGTVVRRTPNAPEGSE